MLCVEELFVHFNFSYNILLYDLQWCIHPVDGFDCFPFGVMSVLVCIFWSTRICISLECIIGSVIAGS